MARDRERTDLIVVTDTMTHARQDIGTRTIAKQAIDEGVYSDAGPLGVHFLIRRSGTIEIGRDMLAEGQHLLGYNDVAVYIMLVGGATRQGEREDNSTREQRKSLEILTKLLWRIYPSAILAPQDALCGMGGPSLDLYAWEVETFNSGHERRLLEYMAERTAAAAADAMFDAPA